MPRLDRRYKKGSIEEPTVNLTPLIDVVFVILIMFILIAPLLEIDRIELAIGALNKKEEQRSAHEASPLAIYVHADDSISYRGHKIPIAKLSFMLKEDKSRYPGVRPQLFQDQKARFGTYQKVKNSVDEAGFDSMDVVLKPG